MAEWWKLSREACQDELGVRADAGLTDAQAAEAVFAPYCAHYGIGK